MKKVGVIILAAVLAMATVIYAGAQEQQETELTETDTQAAADSKAEEPTEQKIGGHYIANFAQASDRLNLAILAEPDLIWAAQQAETPIYYFAEDGTVRIYQSGSVTDGTYEVTDDTLTIETPEGTEEYSCEFIDGLLVLRNEAGSSLLYDFAIEDMDYITIEDYSTIEVPASQVEVTEENVDNYIRTVLQGQTTYEQITEGETAEGDIITISYEGVLEGETEPFEGGTAEGLTVQLGSGALIGNYEEQLIGQKIGTTVAVAITYPEDYTKIEGLAGKKAVFTTTIQSKTLAHTPELTDAWVQEYSAQSLPEELETVEDYRAFCRNYLEEYALHTAMINALAAKSTITGYNLTLAQMLVDSLSASLSQNAAFYGVSEEAFVKSYGYDTTDAYKQQEATYDLNLAMIVNKVMTDLNLTYTAEELDADLNNYLRLSGFSKNHTVESYKQQVGAIGLWVYDNLEFKLDKAMAALEDRVVLTENAPAAETSAEEASTEEASVQE